MDFQKNARGIYTDDSNPPDLDLLLLCDFMVAKLGTSFHDNVQRAYDLDMPCILFAEHHVTRAHIDMTFERLDWNNAIEQEPLIKQLDAAIYSNGVRRAIHGIMLDCSYVKVEGEDEILTYNWFVQRSRWMLDTIWSRYRLPIYLYQNKTPIKTFTSADGHQSLIKLLFDYGVSTVDLIITDEPERLPDLPYNDAGYGWWFWLYKTVPFTMMYVGTAAELYDQLNYTISDPPEYPPDDEIPLPIEDAEDWIVGLAQWVTSVELRLAQMQGSTDHEGRIADIEDWIRKAKDI